MQHADHPVETIHIRSVGVGVAPVQAAAAVGTHNPALAFMSPAIAGALMGKEPGRCAGTSEAWPQWRRRWLNYVREIEELMPTTFSNRQHLTVLRHWLDEATADSLDAEMERDENLQYERYWARLDLSFGGDDRDALRRQLRATRLQHRGRLTEKEWRDFAQRALTLSRQIGDVTDIELGRMYVDNLPPHPWRRKIIEETEKRQQNNALLMGGFPAGTTEQDVALLVEMETHSRPLNVTAIGSKFRVATSGAEQKELLKAAFDRQQLQCGATTTVDVEHREMGAADINNMMLKWLRIDAKAGSTSGSMTARDTDTESAMRHRQLFQHRQ